MSPHFCCLLLWTLLGRYIEASVNKNSMDKLGFNNYNDIVRDLIKNWESPIVYLRQLGYLPSDYEDTSKIKPNLDALMDRIDRYDQMEALSSNSADQVDKSKEHICGTVDAKNQKMTKKREMGSIDYPTVDQLMEMTQQFNKMKLDQSALKQAESAQLLQRLVEKTSPAVQQTQDNVAAAGRVATAAGSAQFPLMPKLAMLKLLSGNTVKEPTQILSGILENGENSAMSIRQDQAQPKINILPDIEAPQYLNWDFANNKLKQASPFAKDAYVDKLVDIFVKRQKALNMLENKQSNDT